MSNYKIEKSHLKILDDAVEALNKKPLPLKSGTAPIEVEHREADSHAFIQVVKGDLVITSMMWSDDMRHAHSSHSLITKLLANLMFWALVGREDFEEQYKN